MPYWTPAVNWHVVGMWSIAVNFDCQQTMETLREIRVFPKVDHSANVARIVLDEKTKFLLKIWQRFDKVLAQ